MPSDSLPDDLMTAEDDQLLAWLSEQTMSDDMGRWEGPCQTVADFLDPIDAVDCTGRIAGFDDDNLAVLIRYAKLGRNAFLRHFHEESDHA